MISKHVLSRIEMLLLSLHDCNLDSSNICIKEYEKECLYSLYPDYGKTVDSIQVIFLMDC